MYVLLGGDRAVRDGVARTLGVAPGKVVHLFGCPQVEVLAESYPDVRGAVVVMPEKFGDAFPMMDYIRRAFPGWAFIGVHGAPFAERFDSVAVRGGDRSQLRQAVEDALAGVRR